MMDTLPDEMIREIISQIPKEYHYSLFNVNQLFRQTTAKFITKLRDMHEVRLTIKKGWILDIIHFLQSIQCSTSYIAEYAAKYNQMHIFDYIYRRYPIKNWEFIKMHAYKNNNKKIICLSPKTDPWLLDQLGITVAYSETPDLSKANASSLELTLKMGNLQLSDIIYQQLKDIRPWEDGEINKIVVSAFYNGRPEIIGKLREYHIDIDPDSALYGSCIGNHYELALQYIDHTDLTSDIFYEIVTTSWLNNVNIEIIKLLINKNPDAAHGFYSYTAFVHNCIEIVNAALNEKILEPNIALAHACKYQNYNLVMMAYQYNATECKHCQKSFEDHQNRSYF